MHTFTRRAAAILIAAAAAVTTAAPAVATPAPAALSSNPPIDHLGRPAPHILEQVRTFAQQPFVPRPVRGMLAAAIGFFEGGGKPGAPLPENGPVFAQFGWPTVADQCIVGTNKATGTAIAVPGPADIPLPGVPAGHAAFVFTALGTGTVSETQVEPMTVQWVNINTGRMGTTTLTYNDINPDGPATVSGLADTGSGTVVAYLSGGVTTREKDIDSNCRFLPTAGIFDVK